MKTWKEEKKIKESYTYPGFRGFSTKKMPSGYKPSPNDRAYMKGCAMDIGDTLVELAMIAGGKSKENFEETKSLCNSMINEYYKILDDMRR